MFLVDRMSATLADGDQMTPVRSDLIGVSVDGLLIDQRLVVLAGFNELCLIPGGK